jgi:predicted transposase YdaD
MGLRYDKDTIHPLFHGIQKMRESSTYQAILEEGIEEGEVASRQQDVLDLLEERFGAVPADVAARVRGCRDAARLRTVLRQCVRIAAPADLRVPD